MAPFWLPFGHPNRPKIGPRSVQDGLETLYFQKTRFLTRPFKTNAFLRFLDPKMASKMAQDRPKTASRRSYCGSFFASIFVFDFGPFWARFWSLLGRLLAPKLGPKSIKNRPQIARPLLDQSWGGLGVILGLSWGGLGRSWGALGRCWGGHGAVLGGLGSVLGRS